MEKITYIDNNIDVFIIINVMNEWINNFMDDDDATLGFLR